MTNTIIETDAAQKVAEEAEEAWSVAWANAEEAKNAWRVADAA